MCIRDRPFLADDTPLGVDVGARARASPTSTVLPALSRALSGAVAGVPVGEQCARGDGDDSAAQHVADDGRDELGAAAHELGIDAQLRSMSGLRLRPTAAVVRKQRMARIVTPTLSAPADERMLASKLAFRPKARDVGRRYDDEEVDQILLGPKTPFGACSGRQIRALREVTEQMRYERHTEVVSEGVFKASARHFFVIVEGQVAVRSQRGYEALLGPADCFGEIALITVRPRMLLVVTRTPCLILRIAAEELHTKLLASAVRECFPRIELASKKMLLRALPFFARLSEAAITQLIPFFSYAEVSRGQYLCREGDPSRCIYVVAFGAVEALIDGTTRVGLCTHSDDKPWLGELALFKDARRPASLRTAEPSHILTLDVDQVHEIVKITPSLMEMFRSAELADVYARMSSAPRWPGGLPALHDAAPVHADWRELLGTNFFARRAHFSARLDRHAGAMARPEFSNHARHHRAKQAALFF